jgi:hypothetical protein
MNDPVDFAQVVTSLVEIQKSLHDVTFEETPGGGPVWRICWGSSTGPDEIAKKVDDALSGTLSGNSKHTVAEFFVLRTYLNELDGVFKRMSVGREENPILNDEELFYAQIEHQCDCIRNLQRQASTWTEPLLIMLRNSQERSQQEELFYVFPAGIIEEDVTQAVNLTYDEVMICFENRCYTSSITLCGKIVETILAGLYASVCGGDADEENLGIDAICNRLKKHGYDLKKDALQSMMDVISCQRNKAVHGSIIIPTSAEAKGVVLLTKDVMQKAASRRDS